MSNIIIYVCDQSVYEKELQHITSDIIVYPEIKVPFNEWFDYYTSIIKDRNVTIVTQSSEVLKVMDTFDISCDIYLWNGTSFRAYDNDTARKSLLGCYETLMFSQSLFKD